MNPYIYLVEFNKDEQVWEVIRETLDSDTAGFIPDASLLVGTCPNENTAVNAAFQLQRYGVVTGAVPDHTAASTPRYAVGLPVDMCYDEHGFTGNLCSRLEGHTGRHAAGDGTYIVAVWE